MQVTETSKGWKVGSEQSFDGGGVVDSGRR